MLYWTAGPIHWIKKDPNTGNTMEWKSWLNDWGPAPHLQNTIIPHWYKRSNRLVATIQLGKP